MTDAQLRDAAITALKATTVSYPVWKRNVDRGRYKDVTATQWWKALDLLGKIGASPTPAPDIYAPFGPFTVLDGKGTTPSFPQAMVRTKDPLTIRKLHVKNVTAYGIGSQQYYPPTTEYPGRTLLEDCVAENVSAVPPRSSDGTAESCYWFGNPTTARRFVGRNGSWMTMWTGSKSFGSLFEDFELTGPSVGLYVEHETQDCTFRRFRIESQSTGITFEWWYGGEGSHSNVFEDGEIYCPAHGSEWNSYYTAGIFADAGTWGCTFRRIRFWGPGDAIGLPNRLAGPAKNVVENCVFENEGREVYYHDNAIG